MGRDDYHVIVYQILSYLYVQLKAGEPVFDEGRKTGQSKTYSHPVSYWKVKHSLEREAFAHFFEAYARNDVEKQELLKIVFPNAIAVFQLMLDDF